MPKDKHRKHTTTHAEAEISVAEKAQLLFRAVVANSAANVTRITKMGCDIDYTTSIGQTALHLATSEGYTEIMEILINAGANINFPMHGGVTPLDIALKFKQESAINLLLTHGAKSTDFTAEEKANRLFKAVLDNLPAGVGEAIRLGGDVNYPGPGGRTALHVATSLEYTEVMGILVEAGAKLDALTAAGETPLDIAQTYKKEKAVALLTSSRFFPSVMKPKQAWLDEGLRFLEQRKVDDALRAFHQAIKIDPAYAEAVYPTVQILLTKGKTDLAIEAIDRYQSHEGTDVKVLALRISCAAQYVGSDMSLDEATLLRRGVELQSTKEYVLAKKYFEATLALNPDCMDARKQLVQLAAETYEVGSGSLSPAQVVAKMIWGSTDIGTDGGEKSTRP